LDHVDLFKLITVAYWELAKHKYDYFWLYLFLFTFFFVAEFFIIRKYHRHFMQALKAYPSYRFVLFSIGFLFVAQILDMRFIDLEFGEVEILIPRGFVGRSVLTPKVMMNI